MATSILKNKGKKRKADNRKNNAVSFANNKNRSAEQHQERNNGRSTSASSSQATRQKHSASDNNGPKSTHFLHDEEEDAFDPETSNYAKSDGDYNETDDKQIRDAKADRATRRALASANLTDGNFGEHKKGGRSHRGGDGVFEGEEEVDKHISLINNDNNDDDVDTDGTSENDKEQCPIEPFNLESEREDGMGYFDGDTYVFRRGNRRGIDEEEDAWLDDEDQEQDGGLQTNKKQQDTNTVMNSFVVQKRKVEKASGSNGSRRSSFDEATTKDEAYRQLIPLLATAKETVMQALGRYGSIIKREKKIKQKGAKTLSKEATATTASQQSLERLTEIANFCMMKFNDGGNIYERSKEYLQETLAKNESQGDSTKKRQQSYFSTEDGSKRAKIDVTSEEPKNDKKDVLWEYKGNQDNNIHGPYTTKQMLDWTAAGYFVGSMAVDIRIISGESEKKKETSIQEVKEKAVEDLLGDLDDSDDEEEATKETAEWMRSDKVNFSSYDTSVGW